MHKLHIKILAILSVIAMLLAFAGCKQGPAQESESATDNYHTITFNSNGGSRVDPIKVLHGHHATQPDDPVLSNFIFCHWELPDGRTWFFDIKRVEEDLHLEAIWIKAETLFSIEPIPETSNIAITKIKKQEEFNLLKVPSVINGKTVVEISDEAFFGVHQTYAKNILIPETVTVLGDRAFSGISDVNITFNGAITYLGEAVFENSNCITGLKLGEGLEVIPFRAFANCVNLKTIDIPKGVTLIDENAFENCESMVTIVIPETLTTIANSAFEDCDTLKTVFYKGTPEQFENIEISNRNDLFEAARVCYYSEQEPTTEGDFWHYGKNGMPTIW